ncbi:MAG: ankyrin repeat domain-containing protein [Limisphaerales bacterium]
MTLPRSPLILAALLLAACGDRSPEQAQQKLATIHVAPTPEALIAKTKDPKAENVAKLLVEAGVDPNARQANGMTALMSAAFNGQRDVAEALLKRGADVKADARGYNALALSVEKGDKAMVKLLLAHGASPTERPAGGLSALERAQNRQDGAMVELLSRGGK